MISHIVYFIVFVSVMYAAAAGRLQPPQIFSIVRKQNSILMIKKKKINILCVKQKINSLCKGLFFNVCVLSISYLNHSIRTLIKIL